MSTALLDNAPQASSKDTREVLYTALYGNLGRVLPDLEPNPSAVCVFAFLLVLCQFHRSGRAKDPRKHHGEADETREDRESGAKLEYRDEWGREVTRKEAFRNLCYQVRYKHAKTGLNRLCGRQGGTPKYVFSFFVFFSLIFLCRAVPLLSLFLFTFFF